MKNSTQTHKNNISDLSIEKLERTSINWDKRTKELLLFVCGSGNMFGGSGRMIHITLHGENSIYETGTCSLNGLVEYGTNIARGANGESSANMKYYKGVNSFTEIGYNKAPNFEITIAGTCGGADGAICEILSATKEWSVNNDYRFK